MCDARGDCGEDSMAMARGKHRPQVLTAAPPPSASRRQMRRNWLCISYKLSAVAFCRVPLTFSLVQITQNTLSELLRLSATHLMRLK